MYRGEIMLGYSEEDLQNMLEAVESILTTVNEDDDPWMGRNLYHTAEFLRGLLVEGHVQ